jgi:hypothetical protein
VPTVSSAGIPEFLAFSSQIVSAVGGDLIRSRRSFDSLPIAGAAKRKASPMIRAL